MILNVAPRFDAATQYSYQWNRRLMEELSEPVVELLERDATRENVEKALSERGDVDLVVFHDHGTREGLVEQGGAGYVIDKKNCSLLRGREVYTMACLWGSDGGADAYRKGARAVWAYVEAFVFTTTDEGVFGRLANMGLTLRRKRGLSWEECVRRVKEAYGDEIDARREGSNPWTLIALIHDRDALVCWTDANQPPTDCTLRAVAVRLLGIPGQKISRCFAIGLALFFASWGVALHDYCHALFQVGGYHEILGPQGGYIGFAGMIAAVLLLTREHIRWLGS